MNESDINQEDNTITIEPLTRLEGEGKVNIILNTQGEVKKAYFQVLDYRGFERFLTGREAEEVPRIVTRMCGFCSWAHHMASVKAIDELYGREIPKAAEKLRRLSYFAHIVHSHLIHFFVCASPDLFLSPNSRPSARNIIGLLQKYPEIGKDALKYHAEAEKIQEIIGGKAIHPMFAIPGGVSKTLTENERDKIEQKTKEILDFSLETLELFKEKIIENEGYEELFFGDLYRLNTYYMGLIDDKGQLNFYDGKLEVMDPEGKDFATFPPSEYLDHISEKTQPWSYSKFPYLKNVGWKGFKDGKESGVYRVNSLARLNITDGMPTEKAQKAYEEFTDALGHPAHATIAYNWARIIETIYCSERMLELLQDPSLVEGNAVNRQGNFTGEGIGVVEAPRGTLIHHYEANKEGSITNANLIIPTTMNNASISMDIEKAASKLIHNGDVSEGILNQIEMAYRAYDPCLSCSSHSLPGKAPLEVILRREDGEIIRRLRRDQT